jgi:hypothetical protein
MADFFNLETSRFSVGFRFVLIPLFAFSDYDSVTTFSTCRSGQSANDY